MESYEKGLQSQHVNLEKLNEELLNILSLIILLESDMETQKADNIHLRAIKMVHYAIKKVQKNLLKTDKNNIKL